MCGQASVTSPIGLSWRGYFHFCVVLIDHTKIIQSVHASTYTCAHWYVDYDCHRVSTHLQLINIIIIIIKTVFAIKISSLVNTVPKLRKITFNIRVKMFRAGTAS
jgi:hypothetical protein